MCCGACCTTIKEPISEIVPYEKRSCTDILWVLLFAGAWAIIIGVFIHSHTDGDVQRCVQRSVCLCSRALAPMAPHTRACVNSIFRGVDYKGRVCGKHGDVKDLPYTAWPNPTAYSVRMCVSSCDETKTNENFTIPLSSKRGQAACRRPASPGRSVRSRAVQC